MDGVPNSEVDHQVEDMGIDVVEDVQIIMGEPATPKVVEGAYRKVELPVPEQLHTAPGIKLFDRTVRSLVFSTDLAIIRNCDADAVLAVYPFTCQPAITQALVQACERPILAGVAGTLTNGVRSVLLAVQSEMQGASAVVVNATTKAPVVRNIARSIDIPVVLTVVAMDSRVPAQLGAGARIANVAAGPSTPQVVAQLREKYPDLPIMASGGPSGETAAATIAAGADAITWTPPSMSELEHVAMEHNRASVEPEPLPLHSLLLERINSWRNGAAKQ